MTDYDKYLSPKIDEKLSDEEKREHLRQLQTFVLFSYLQKKVDFDKFPDDEDVNKEELIDYIIEKNYYE